MFHLCCHLPLGDLEVAFLKYLLLLLNTVVLSHCFSTEYSTLGKADMVNSFCLLHKGTKIQEDKGIWLNSPVYQRHLCLGIRILGPMVVWCLEYNLLVTEAGGQLSFSSA